VCKYCSGRSSTYGKRKERPKAKAHTLALRRPRRSSYGLVGAIQTVPPAHLTSTGAHSDVGAPA
jgi:hypothetical protein